MEQLEQYCALHGEPERSDLYLGYCMAQRSDAEIGLSLRRRNRPKLLKGGPEEDTDALKARRKKNQAALAGAGRLTAGSLRSIMDMMLNSELFGKSEFVTKIKIGTVGRYSNFVEKMRVTLANFDPKVIPDSWWDLAVNEVAFRAQNFVFPLSATDVGLWYDWATNWVTTEVAEKTRAHGMDVTTIFVEDFQKFALAWRPALETALSGTAPLIQKVAFKLVKELTKLIVRVVKTAVFFILDIISRVLKSIPYTFWLGYILGYVFTALEAAVNVVI